MTDVKGNRHESFEKLSRGAGGVAGAQADPFRVWLEDWSVTAEAATGATTPYRQPPARLKAEAGGYALDLRLVDEKGPVLQGDRGYSQKGADPGNASYYYSLTRLETTGDVTIGGKTYAVTGLSWMDHEYSTSALGPGQAGWDWFSLQLSNDTELMLFQLRGQTEASTRSPAGLSWPRTGRRPGSAARISRSRPPATGEARERAESIRRGGA